MKKSVNLYFAKSKAQKAKIEEIKAVGFDEFFLGVADATEDLSLTDLVNYAKKLGLKCTMIHCSYDDRVRYFWEDGIEGEQVCEDYCAQIKQCKGLTENFVVHLHFELGQETSKIGLARIQKMLKVCDECNLNLCVENLLSVDEIPYIFKHLQHEKLKICFDSGHQNFAMPGFDLLEQYSDYVTVLHLHDNHGVIDDHLPCGEGTTNWEKIAQKLKFIPNIVLSSEVKSGKEEIDKAYLSKVYEGLCMVENLIKK